MQPGRLNDPSTFGYIFVRLGSRQRANVRRKDIARIELGALHIDLDRCVRQGPTVGGGTRCRVLTRYLRARSRIRMEAPKALPKGIE